MTTRTGELSPAETTDPKNWTNKLRGRIEGLVPPGQALPARQPVYVASWIYVFGVLTLSSLVWSPPVASWRWAARHGGTSPRSVTTPTRSICGAWR